MLGRAAVAAVAAAVWLAVSPPVCGKGGRGGGGVGGVAGEGGRVGRVMKNGLPTVMG